MAELIFNSRLFWMKTIYLRRTDVKPLALLLGGICDSGRNALTDISRCLPTDDGVHGIPCFDNGQSLLDARPSVVLSHPCRAVSDTRTHKSVPARLSDGLSRPGLMIGYRLGYHEDGRQGGVPLFSMMMIHIDESNCIISQLYVLDLCNWFE